jgi:hypothetical protein
MLQALLLLLGLGLVALGAEKLYYIYANPQQLTMRCVEYARSQPSAVWLRLTECEADYLGAGYRESGGRIAELFFPIRPAGRPRTEPAALVAATSDPEALAIAQAAVGDGRAPDQEQFLVMMKQIVTALGGSREIEGWGRAGMLERMDARRSLASLSSPIEPDAIVLDLHGRPQPTVPALQLVTGALAIGGALLLQRRSRRPATARPAEPAAAAPRGTAETAVKQEPSSIAAAEHQPPDAAPEPDAPAAMLSIDHGGDMLSFPAEDEAAAAPPEPPPVPATDLPKLRGLLLLRLPPSANASDIENAPPLGAREAVMRRIADVIPDVRFDESGQGRVSDPGCLLVVDLGPDPLVPTAIARAEGARAIDLLRTLLTSAGWRAFSPRSASFIEPDRLHAAAGGSTEDQEIKRS